MRILTLSNTPLDAAQGSGYVVLGYAAGLRARGHHVDVRGPADYEPFHRLRRAIRYRQALGMAGETLRRLAGEDHDVLEIYGAEGWLAFSLLARMPGRRCLLVSHSNGIETHAAEAMADLGEPGEPGDQGEIGPPRPRRKTRLPLQERAFHNADAIVTVGDFDRDYALARNYAPPDRVLAIDNPLPDSYLGLPLHLVRPPILGFCGTWLPRKGTALIQSDLPPLLRRHPAWNLTLVGVGPGFRPDHHFPPDLLPRITVVPQADRETDLQRLYQTFAIFIQASRYESFGLTTAEAMACGCALAATPTGFAATLRPDQEAILTIGHHPSALEDALTPLLENPTLRRHIATAGHARVQSLRWSPAITRLETAYQTWLQDLRTGHP